MSSTPSLIFGCANIGYSFTTESEVSSLLSAVKSAGITHLDTAARYPPTSPGLSQKLLGEAEASKKGFSIDTKIRIIGTGFDGHLSAPAIKESLDESLVSLKADVIEVLYCHAPDNKTPLEEQAIAFDTHFKQGKFKYLGVSNFSVKMIEDWMSIAEEKGLVKPSVFEGQYNLFCRDYEDRLFPTLRKYNMVFNAFSPLAGGFLTGKYRSKEAAEQKSNRWEPSDGNLLGKAFRHWYDKESMHRAIDELSAICEKYQVSTAEAAIRWIVFHSALRAGDGVILGASRVSQVQPNVADIGKGPLDEELVKTLNGLFAKVEKDAADINP